MLIFSKSWVSRGHDRMVAGFYIYLGNQCLSLLKYLGNQCLSLLKYLGNQCLSLLKYLGNQCLSLLKLWVGIPLNARCFSIHYVKEFVSDFGRLVVFSRYSGFLHHDITGNKFKCTSSCVNFNCYFLIY